MKNNLKRHVVFMCLFLVLKFHINIYSQNIGAITDYFSYSISRHDLGLQEQRLYEYFEDDNHTIYTMLEFKIVNSGYSLTESKRETKRIYLKKGKNYFHIKKIVYSGNGQGGGRISFNFPNNIYCIVGSGVTSLSL